MAVPCGTRRRPRGSSIGDRQVTGFDAAGDVIVFTVTTPAALSDLYVLRNGTEERLTTLGERFASRRTLISISMFL